ncbi:uncharacterized protein LOC135128906 [Zophobas morio]|uniref:uncharacterized protein LOC135128906 n=1 Tax=Zophobas morio TaxID=2755281 RepID=UPI00308398F8
MKVAVLLAYAVLTTRRVTCAAIHAPLDVISLEDITETDRRHLEYLNSYYNYPSRSKRSGDDALNHLKASIGQGIKSKLGLLAKGSASASGSFSKGSKSYHHHDVHPDYDHHHKFDLWSLKKSILNTLLQAVKAIKGGVIAIKGQLIKGSGYLISAKGKLISSKGEAITKLGKNIATSAVLSPTHGHSEEHDHAHYHHSAPEEYGSPSAPGPEYEVPEHHYHHHHHEDKHGADHSGILILKKIPTHEHSEHPPAEHKVPDFKHIDHKGPGWGEIIGKFFSASTSLKPGHPAPFGDDHHHHYTHDDDHHPSSHEDYHHPSSHEDYHDSSHVDSHEYSSSSNDSPKTSLFEEAPPFLNGAEYASESKGAAATQAPQTTPASEPPKPAPIKYDEVRPLSSFSNVGFDGTSFLANSDRFNYFGGALSEQPNANFPALSVSLPAMKPVDGMQYGAFQNPGAGTDLKYLAELGPQVFPRQNGFVSRLPG